MPSSLTSPIVTLAVGPDQRLFAAHEDVLSHSPYLGSLCQAQFYETNKRIDLSEEQPEILSCILEYLYKGDYYPKLEYDKRRHSWALEDDGDSNRTTNVEVVVPTETGEYVKVLKDTIIYVSLVTTITIIH
jgi:BTB/POZ domain